jgi:hypothetical protein
MIVSEVRRAVLSHWQAAPIVPLVCHVLLVSTKLIFWADEVKVERSNTKTASRLVTYGFIYYFLKINGFVTTTLRCNFQGAVLSAEKYHLPVFYLAANMFVPRKFPLASFTKQPYI